MVSQHGLDPLSDAAEFPEPGFLVSTVGANQRHSEFVKYERFGSFPDEC